MIVTIVASAVAAVVQAVVSFIGGGPIN